MITKQHIAEVLAQGPYQPTWPSLAQFQLPGWFRDAKFGIFTHWGLYTILEYRNEWYSRNMYIEDYPEFRHHVRTYGPQKEFGYKDFIPQFTAEKFDAQEWLDLFQQAGAKYYMPVAEHHDGFQMYASALSHYNAVEMGPKRDILGELRQAATDHGMHFAASNHRAEHWWFMGHGQDFSSDIQEPLKRGDFYWPAMPEPDRPTNQFSQPYPTEEFLTDWELRVCELVENYHPELLYFDWWIAHQAFHDTLQRVAAFYYNTMAHAGLQGAICYKQDALAFGTGIPELERGSFADAQPYVWQSDTAIARNSWSYTTTLDYKSTNEILITLIDTVSKNGNLLLNVGPRADGSIAPGDRKILADIGRWLAVNGEGIYGSRPWRFAQEGPTPAADGDFQDQQAIHYTPQDIRYTANHGALYAFSLAPQAGQTITLTMITPDNDARVNQFHGLIDHVEQLGYGPIPFDNQPSGIVVHPVLTESTAPVGFKIIMQ
ncbi:alpha-L-fucosidase [Schleiferilactobacillus harbinensis]|uniref:alpha-L-fucosidase n=1 Tax=Schleiferilactobacillus harbinensis TaxID=304207 RepID=A0A5P8M1M4_9LACO|nr:alpha-L-fucosidase [Schleiferilactobacillus harbinensis]QFR22400.1 alpha-L-fucosidase [Schleiferilactobacillus harbinensis]